jgi:YtoQ family protein
MQWNAAFDAGYCVSSGKPYITLHDDNILHALKEVDAAALAWTRTPDEVVKIIQYSTSQE